MLKTDGKTRLVGKPGIYDDGSRLEPHIMEALEYFAFLLECHQQHVLVCRDLDCQANLIHCKTAIRVGKKFVKVDVGTSGRYMVDLATGIIHGIKAYGVIHRGHSYGKLSEVDARYWGLYHGIALVEAGGLEIC